MAQADSAALKGRQLMITWYSDDPEVDTLVEQLIEQHADALMSALVLTGKPNISPSVSGGPARAGDSRD